jgi:hypothetical protein
VYEVIFTQPVASPGDWFSIAFLPGTTLASFRIMPRDFATDTPATSANAVTVNVTSSLDLADSQHQIDLTLKVIDSIRLILLPIVLSFCAEGAKRIKISRGF